MNAVSLADDDFEDLLVGDELQNPSPDFSFKMNSWT